MPSGDFGTKGRAFLRVAGRRSGENRWVRALYSAGKVTAGAVGRILHVLWLEVTGLLFLALAAIGGAAAVRGYRLYSAGTGGLAKPALAAVFALVFVYFGVTSFWRSRKR